MSWDFYLFVIFGSLLILVSLFCYVYTIVDLFRKKG